MNDEVEEIEVITIPTKIKYKGMIWVPQPTSERTNSYTPKNPKTKHVEETNINFTIPVEPHIKQSYLVKWLNKNRKVGDVFILEDFYKKYPKHKKDVGCRNRIEKIISNLIREDIITQWTNPGEFRILKTIQNQAKK